jgi:hypothetical protein
MEAPELALSRAVIFAGIDLAPPAGRLVLGIVRLQRSERTERGAKRDRHRPVVVIAALVAVPALCSVTVFG